MAPRLIVVVVLSALFFAVITVGCLIALPGQYAACIAAALGSTALVLALDHYLLRQT